MSNIEKKNEVYGVYAVTYINTENPLLSETLGVCTTHDLACNMIAEKAGYKIVNNVLQQYFENIDEELSMLELLNSIKTNNYLSDGDDMYRINHVPYKTTHVCAEYQAYFDKQLAKRVLEIEANSYGLPQPNLVVPDRQNCNSPFCISLESQELDYKKRIIILK